MAKPTLLIVAGCNGSGKSTYSRLLVSTNFIPFDYDHYYIQYYRTLIDSDFKETMAHNMAWQTFEDQINNAIRVQGDFCFETNFNSTPLHWPQIFKKQGYRLELIYLCLSSINEANRRVEIRVKNGGHYVSEEEVMKRYYDGFSNLNQYFNFFDLVHLFDSSNFMERPKHILSLTHGKIAHVSAVPSYLNKLVPNILSLRMQ